MKKRKLEGIIDRWEKLTGQKAVEVSDT